MNWKQLILSLCGAAAAGFGASVGTVPAGTPGAKGIIVAGTIAPVIAMLGGIFQTPPHQNG